MGYFYLSVSLISGAIKGFCGKKLSGYATNTQSAVFLNFIRMVICIVFGFTVILLNRDASKLTLIPDVVFVSAASGISTSFFVVSWILCARKNAYIMLDVFLMLGTIIPMLMGQFLFQEIISIREWGGFVLLVVAAFIMCSYNNSVKTKITLSSLGLLVACGVSNGITGFTQKLYVKSFPDLPVTIFNFYTYIFAAITLLICFLLGGKKEKVVFDKSFSKRSVFIVLVMAISLMTNSQFKTMAAVTLDSATLFPLSQGFSLVLTILMATILFKEKFTFKAFVGILLAFIALLVMNL